MTALDRQNASWLAIKAKCAEDAKCRPCDVECVLRVWFSAITESLKKNNDVQIDGFATFSVGKRAARVVHNFKTGGEFRAPARKVPKFWFVPGLTKRIKQQGFT